MDTLMMWIGFSLLFCRWERDVKLWGWTSGILLKNTDRTTATADLEVLLIVETRTRVQQWFGKAGEDLVKIPAKEAH